MRAPKPIVICNEIPVRSKWTVVNIEHGRVKDCANWPRVMKFGTDVDKDIIIPLLTCPKASGHLQWHTGQFIVDTGQHIILHTQD